MVLEEASPLVLEAMFRHWIFSLPFIMEVMSQALPVQSSSSFSFQNLGTSSLPKFVDLKIIHSTKVWLQSAWLAFGF